MKGAKDIEVKIAAILSITNEVEVLSEMRGYAESLADKQFEYAHNYAKDYLAKRAAGWRRRLQKLLGNPSEC